jgi:acetylornithine/N-succinyldiaminopimelate aminotransferase
MKLADTGLTVQDIKEKVNTYMIETYETNGFSGRKCKRPVYLQ